MDHTNPQTAHHHQLSEQYVLLIKKDIDPYILLALLLKLLLYKLHGHPNHAHTSTRPATRWSHLEVTNPIPGLPPAVLTALPAVAKRNPRR